MTMAGLLAVLATGCEKNNDPDIKPGYSMDIEPQNLHLTYNGVSLDGKAASVAVTGNRLTVELSGADFDLTPYLGDAAQMVPGLPQSLPTTGVFPGSASTTLEATLASDNAFSGSGQSDCCTFDYSGTLADGILTCDFTNVLLKDQSFAGTYAPRTELEDWFGDMTIVNKGYHYVWESSDLITVDLGGGAVIGPISIGDMVTLSLAFAGGINPADKIGEHLEHFEFRPDGNVIMSYMTSAENGGEALVSPANVCHYVYEGTRLRVYVNPAAIVAAAAAGRSRADEGGLDLTALIKSLTDYYVPMVADGIPVQVTQEADSVELYLDNQLMNPIFKAAGAVLSVPDIQEMIKQMAAANMPEMAPMLNGILPQLPGAIANTTRFEVGLSLVKQ